MAFYLYALFVTMLGNGQLGPFCLKYFHYVHMYILIFMVNKTLSLELKLAFVSWHKNDNTSANWTPCIALDNSASQHIFKILTNAPYTFFWAFIFLFDFCFCFILFCLCLCFCFVCVFVLFLFLFVLVFACSIYRVVSLSIWNCCPVSWIIWMNLLFYSPFEGETTTNKQTNKNNTDIHWKLLISIIYFYA